MLTCIITEYWGCQASKMQPKHTRTIKIKWRMINRDLFWRPLPPSSPLHAGGDQECASLTRRRSAEWCENHQHGTARCVVSDRYYGFLQPQGVMRSSTTYEGSFRKLFLYLTLPRSHENLAQCRWLAARAKTQDMKQPLCFIFVSVIRASSAALSASV